MVDCTNCIHHTTDENGHVCKLFWARTNGKVDECTGVQNESSDTQIIG